MSLAIGKRGQNVRTLPRLTGYKIDISQNLKLNLSILEGDDVETDQDIDDSNVSNEEATESTAEQLEEDSSERFSKWGRY